MVYNLNCARNVDMLKNTGYILHHSRFITLCPNKTKGFMQSVQTYERSNLFNQNAKSKFIRMKTIIKLVSQIFLGGKMHLRLTHTHITRPHHSVSFDNVGDIQSMMLYAQSQFHLVFSSSPVAMSVHILRSRNSASFCFALYNIRRIWSLALGNNLE